MAETESSSDGGIAQRIAEFLVDRVLPFPWTGGFLAGCGGFVAGYLILVVYFLVGVIKRLPGATGDKLIRLGFIHYNAHRIPVIQIATSPLPGNQSFAGRSFTLLSAATDPGLYYAVPVVALLGASMVFTYYNLPERQSATYAALTGLAMTIGYLLFALVGTYVFVKTRSVDPNVGESFTIAVRPQRLSTLLYGVVYPLVVGAIGSLPVQAVLIDD